MVFPMKKILIGILVGVVVLGVVAVLVVASMLDSLVKAGLEKVGPQVTQTTFKVAQVKIGLFSGSGTLQGLVLGNPQGYKSDFAMKVGTASVSVEPKSLLSDKIHVRELVLLEPEISFEGTLGSKDNLSKIMENVQAAAGGKAGAAAKPAPGSADPGAGKKIQVDHFLLRGAKVHLDMGLGGLGAAKTTVAIPDIELKDLGQGANGLTGAELTQIVLKEVLTVVSKAAVQKAGDLTKPGGDAVNSLKNGLKGLFQK